MAEIAPSPLDARAGAVVTRLLAQDQEQESMAAKLEPTFRHKVRKTILGAAEAPESLETRQWLANRLMALDSNKAALCYLLCRSIGARRVIEAGTSFGVSTIYLAAAVRDTVAEYGGDGVVIGTEYEPDKVAAARQNLDEAGLSDYAEIREGDLRESLQDLAGPIDFMLVDTWIRVALPALKLVTPHLRPGALVACDNVMRDIPAYADYLTHVRNPDGPFTSVTVSIEGGLELSMKR